jgi:DNA-directed RNA polymerase specialized sigma24 family protein
VLRYYIDCSVPEIATTLRVSDGTVKQHLHRAMDALGRVLEENR